MARLHTILCMSSSQILFLMGQLDGRKFFYGKNWICNLNFSILRRIYSSELRRVADYKGRAGLCWVSDATLFVVGNSSGWAPIKKTGLPPTKRKRNLIQQLTRDANLFFSSSRQTLIRQISFRREDGQEATIGPLLHGRRSGDAQPKVKSTRPRLIRRHKFPRGIRHFSALNEPSIPATAQNDGIVFLLLDRQHDGRGAGARERI